MNQNPGIEAVRKLADMGYRFTVTGETIKAKYGGPGKPDPAAVSLLLDLVSQRKEDVRYFLKCYCPRCGGCCFVPDYEGQPLCLACDWTTLEKLYPAMAGVQH